MDRRALLKVLGLSGLGLGALGPSVASRLARADTPAIPRRILFFHTQQGTLRNLWAPTGMGADYALGELHAESLEPYKSSLLFLNGLAMSSDAADKTQAANAHYAGTTHALTAVDRKSGTLPSGPSIDQYIAGRINEAAPLTKVPSLELAARDVSFGEWAVSFSNDGAPVPFEVDPGAAYDRVFGGFVAPDDTAAKARAAQDDLVLKWAGAEFDALSPRLSGVDRKKLEAHGDALRDLQARITLTSNGCAKPTREGQQGFPGNWWAPESYAPIADMHLRLATAALACDLTRVVTVALPEIPSELVGYKEGDHGTTGLHDLVHQTAENGPLKDNAAAVLPIKKYHQLHSKQFATLLGMLKGIPESDGQTLLDHTLVLWCGQLGSGSHDLQQLPWILAGGGGGFVKSGRHVVYPKVGDKARAHNDLFVSLANYMGIETSTFGNAAVCTGPLDQLT